jgi:hypothetical protein
MTIPYEFAKSLEEQGRTEEAILAYHEAIELDPQDVRAPARKWSDSAGLKMDSF